MPCRSPTLLLGGALLLAGCATTRLAESMQVTAPEVHPEFTSDASFNAKLYFKNGSAEACEVDAYELSWEGGGFKRIEARPTFTVPAKKTVDRVVTVGYVRDVRAFQKSLSVQVYCRVK
ncbi:MAG: hypothetical protein JXR83_03760 [Deltaproteobacteria bacterium]|nr:hypothetical protein [Deltaproteobacteria bacterium]